MSTQLNILLVEDSPDDADLAVAEMRRAGFDPKWIRVENEADFLAEIKKSPDLILSDYSMPQFTGLRAAELLKASGLNIPFILVSGTVGEDVAVEAMKHGATDYLLKDRITRLGSSITNALEQKRLRDEREQAGASLNLFRALLDRSYDGIEVVDPETGHFLVVNETTCRRLGYTREELLSMKVPAIDVAGVTFASWTKNVEEIRRAGFKIIHGQHKRKDGSTFPVEVNVRYVTLDRDYLIAAVRDITERKQFEAELAVREQRLNAFFTRAPAGLVLLDANLRFVQINDTLADMNGVTARDHLGKTVREVLPKLAPVVEPILKQVLMTGTSVLNMEISGETPAQPGVVRHWMESFFPILGTDGRPGGVGAIAVEITERKRTEEKLRESELKFRQLAEHIRKVFWITDAARGQMLYVSPAYEKIWGRTCESLYQSPQSWLDAVHPEDRERVLQAAMIKQERGDYDEIYRIIHRDGSVRWIHDRAFPVRNAAGKLERTVGTAEDVTERKQLEEQFRQTQKQEAIGQLAGGVAHDFNNILTSILMQTELGEMEENLSAEMREGLLQIRLDAERAASLTRQLLLFSRRQVMQSRDLDLNEVVTNLAKMLQRIIGEDVRLQLNLHPAPLLTHADAGMLDQVLMNLAVNARDAMPGGGRLNIETAVAVVDETLAQKSSGRRAGTLRLLECQR